MNDNTNGSYGLGFGQRVAIGMASWGCAALGVMAWSVGKPVHGIFWGVVALVLGYISYRSVTNP